jgi:hypothetical protein
MPIMGNYCKAYSLDRVEKWPEWKNKVRPNMEIARIGDEEAATSYVFIQENYTVTAGIFIDEGILFDDVTPEWKEFCQSTLKFQPIESVQPMTDVSECVPQN